MPKVINGDKEEFESVQPRFSVEYMDLSVDPRQDFFGYCDGGWVKTHPLPADKSRFNTFNEVSEWNLVLLSKIAEDCVNDEIETSSPQYARMVGDFYASALDTEKREQLGFKPIEELWESIESASSVQDIAQLIPKLHKAGVNTFFGLRSEADDRQSSVYATYLLQGGISLPDRDYYLDDAEKFEQIRNAYREHLTKMFMLRGFPREEAQRRSDIVFDFETEMAKASRTATDLRDVVKTYNKMDPEEIEKRYTSIALKQYLHEIGVPEGRYVVVREPEFFDALDQKLSEGDIEKLKIYVQWSLLNAYAPHLHKEVGDEHFNFFKRDLLGQKEPEEGWKSAIDIMDKGIGENKAPEENNGIGEALGKLFVERHFDKAAKVTMEEMARDIIDVLRERIEKLEWMTPQTKQKALEKLDKFTLKIGYPAEFRDYTGLSIEREDYVGNISRSAEFELHKLAIRTGEPFDNAEWIINTPLVNAVNIPNRNVLVFPAGILQPPFFNAGMDPAINYGGIGGVVGHEITHGFDDQGKEYDVDGNLNDWWAPSDAEEFKKRADKVVELYQSQEILPGKFINGKLTLGENIADLGGVSIAYEALQRKLRRDPASRQIIDGFTQEQRFFIACGQLWKIAISEKEQLRRLTIDPHSPGIARATIPTMSQPEFDKAFPPKEAEGREVPKISVW